MVLQRLSIAKIGPRKSARSDVCRRVPTRRKCRRGRLHKRPGNQLRSHASPISCFSESPRGHVSLLPPRTRKFLLDIARVILPLLIVLKCTQTGHQVAIWHIPGKIEQMETVVTRTSAQEKYRLAIKSLMTWMRDVTVTLRIAPTAMSSLMHSQKAAITQITWMPLHHEINQSGKITSLPENAPLDDLSWQFVTASEDGTIAFWDLK